MKNLKGGVDILSALYTWLSETQYYFSIDIIVMKNANNFKKKYLPVDFETLWHVERSNVQNTIAKLVDHCWKLNVDNMKNNRLWSVLEISIRFKGALITVLHSEWRNRKIKHLFISFTPESCWLSEKTTTTHFWFTSQ